MSRFSPEAIDFNSILSNFDLFCKRNIPLSRHKFSSLTEITGGYFGDEITIIGGRPGMGKTSFLLNEFLDVSINQNAKAAFISLQHSKHTLVFKLFSVWLEKEISILTFTEKSESVKKQLLDEIKGLESSKLHVFDNYFPSIDNILDYTFKLIKEEKITIFFIDTLQLIRLESRGKISKVEEIEIILARIREFARCYNLSFIISSDLSRSVECRGGDKRPELYDLRSSGSIEILSDKVIFLYRPEKYNIMEDEIGRSLLNVIEIIVEKNNRGKRGCVKFNFNPSSGVISKQEPSLPKKENKYFDDIPNEKPDPF